MRPFIETLIIAAVIGLGWFQPFRPQVETLIPGLLPKEERPANSLAYVSNPEFQTYQARLRVPVQFTARESKGAVILPAGTLLQIRGEAGDNLMFRYLQEPIAVARNLTIPSPTPTTHGS